MLSQKKNLLNIQGLFSIFTFEDTVLKICGKAQFKLLKPKKVKAFSSETLSNYGFGQIEIQVDRPVLIILSQYDFSKVEIQRLITGL